jgi:cytochrome c556
VKKPLVAALLSAATLALAVPVAYAQFDRPERAIKYRQSVMTLTANHFGRLQPVVKGTVPYDKDAVKANVAIIAMLAPLPWAAFTDGTEKGSNSKPDVWTDAAGFKAAQQKYQQTIAGLSAAADSGDLEKLKVATAAVADSCKGCHDKYQVKR